jgi:hypothetical protein
MRFAKIRLRFAQIRDGKKSMTDHYQKARIRARA